ncbi:HNH endonuclease, partial [bacterium]|nr:HNH endonuclease [bacterium]
KHNGYGIHADHIQPRSKGGKSTLENGQTLCSEHNMLKKNYGTTDFLKKYCEKMLLRARELKDRKIEAMFEELLKVIKRYID